MSHLKCILYFERFSALHCSQTGLSFGTTLPQMFNAVDQLFVSDFQRLSEAVSCCR